MQNRFWPKQTLRHEFGRFAMVGFLAAALMGCLRTSGKVAALPDGLTFDRQPELAVKSNGVPPSTVRPEVPDSSRSSTALSSSGESSWERSSGSSQQKSILVASNRESSIPASQGQAALGRGRTSKSRPSDDVSEERLAKSIALELAEKLPQVKKIRLCYDTRDEEWWITLYQDRGPFFELKQYFWSVVKTAPEPFLVIERVSKNTVEERLRKTEPHQKCQILDPTKERGLAAQPAVADDATRNEPRISAHSQQNSPPEVAGDSYAGQKRTREKSARVAASEPERKSAPAQSVPPVKAQGLDRRSSDEPAVAMNAAAKAQTSASEKPVFRHASAGSSQVKIRPERKHPIYDAEQTRPSRSDSPAPRSIPVSNKAPRPPADANVPPAEASGPTCFVLVYGSQMNHPEFLAWLENNGYDSSLVVDATPGILEGYDFVWNYQSPSRRSGAVNLEPRKRSRICGLLIEVHDSLLSAFDEREGHPFVYSRGEERLPVKRLQDAKTVFAWLYRAKPNMAGRRDVWPSEGYKKKVLDAALFWGFPEEHIEKIRSWKTQ